MTEKIRTFAIHASRGLVVAFLLLLATIYGIGYIASGYGLFDDDGVYLVTAKSLAEGTGYNIISLPSAIPQTKYPPVFPTLLAGIWRVYPHFPQNILALKLVPFLSMLGWLWLSYRLLQRISGSPVASRYIVALSAASPWVVCFTVTLMSEMTFACLLTAALLVLTRLHEEETSRTATVILASVLTGATILTRTAGLPLAFAGAMTLLLNRKFRQALIYSITTAAMLVPWLAWASHSNPPPNSIEAYYSGLNYSSWNLLGNFTWHQRFMVILDNLIFTLASPGYLISGAVHPISGVSVPWILLLLLLAFFTVYGLCLYLSKGITPLSLFVLSYVAILLMWVFPPIRFVIPVLPFVLFFCYIAVIHFFGTVVGSPSGARVIARCCVVFLAFFLALGLFSETQNTLEYRAASLPFRDSSDWNEIVPLSQWIARNATSSSVVVGNLDTVWFLATGRKSVRGYVMDPFEMSYSPEHRNPIGTSADFVQGLLRERADYLMRTHGEGKYLDDFIDWLARAYPNAVTLQMEGLDPDYRIYRIDRAKLIDDFDRSSIPNQTSAATF